MSESLVLHFNQVENRKAVPVKKTPRLYRLASGTRERVLSGSDLGNLQIVADPWMKGSKKTPTFEIFEMVGSSRAVEVAQAIPYLREHGSFSVNVWLSQIDPTLERMVFGNDCPAIITSPKRLLVLGNVPDGNHRLLTALTLSQKGMAVALPALDIQIASHLTAISNVFQFAIRFHSNPVGTIKVLRERFA